MTFDQAVRYMSGLLQFGIRLDRERFVELLRRVGDPHARFPCIHVAGTNGKGSTTNFVAGGLRASGYRVGAYFSPYVFDLRERVQVNGALIEKDAFAHIVTRLRPHIEAIARDTELGQTTEFELKTAVAFVYFAEQVVDFAVVEVGIGGRLDATNVIPPPLVAVITTIGLDHTHLLGDTPAKIAHEKAGILKSGTRACVTAVPPGPALDVIAARARACGVPLRRVAPFASDADDLTDAAVWARYRAGDTPGAVHLQTNDADTDAVHLRLALRGSFQAANAAMAFAALYALRETGAAPRLTDAAIQTGIERALLPGRFQIVERANQPALILDVAHNEDGARVLADAVNGAFPGRPVTLVVGMSRAHDPQPFLRILAARLPAVARVVACAPAFRPKPAEETRAAAQTVFSRAVVETVEPVADAIYHALRETPPSGVVVVTGSFYTVGETPLELRDGDDSGDRDTPQT